MHKLIIALIIAALTGLVAFAWASAGPTHTDRVASQPVIQQACPGSAATPSTPSTSALAIALDGSLSTATKTLRNEYRRAALDAVRAAATNEAAVRVVVFGASGVGARVIFSGSFAPVSTVYAFNLAARNHLLCLAKQALSSAFVGRARLAGTDTAGVIAGQIGWGQSVVRSHGHVSVLALGDGCQAPSPSGANAHLTDLCGELRKGSKPAWILAHHWTEFSFGDSRGVHVTMEGVGVGKDSAAASTLEAENEVRFWKLACRRSRAVCQIGSSVS